MLNWIEPQYSRSRVKAAGKRIRDNRYTAEDVLVVENWRASHAYILNTFQSNLRNRSRGKNITVAQRLKRRPTIFDKLKREPDMQLPTMHDIAGCRLIFKNQEDLFNFRDSLHSSRFKHKLLKHENDKYNYIDNPKSDGYRGVHDVYKYKVSSTHGPKWNGLRIEIQYRTVFQHAWATAVEVADIVHNTRIKFSEADEYHRRFFQLSSEIISRAFEGQRSCLADIDDKEIVEEFLTLDDKIKLIRTFQNLQETSDTNVFKTNTILIFRSDVKNGAKHLATETFDNIRVAISRYEALEKMLEGQADIVLVRAESSSNIRDAFRNYFSDTNEFVKYIQEGCVILNKTQATVKHNHQ